MEVVGQVHGTYIIAQNENGMYMIDQHAAQERIKYEYFREKIEAEEIIKDMIEYVLEHKKVNVKKIREDAAIMMSCKKSIKANHYLKNNEMADLVNQLRETEDPFTCPHGRPIIINFSNYELERLFKRTI